MQSMAPVTIAAPVTMATLLVAMATARPKLMGQSVVPATGPAQQVWPPIPYSFQYEIQDTETGNYQNRAEMKTEAGDVYGSYSVMMPDGYIYTTTYNVTGSSGFISNLIRTLAEPGALRIPVAKSRSIIDDSTPVAESRTNIDDSVHVPESRSIIDDSASVAESRTINDDSANVAESRTINEDSAHVAESRTIINDRADVADLETISNDSQVAKQHHSKIVTVSDRSIADQESNIASDSERLIENKSVDASSNKNLVETVSNTVSDDATTQEVSKAKSLDLVQPEIEKTISEQVAEASSAILPDTSET